MNSVNTYLIIFGGLLCVAGIVLWLGKIGKETYEPNAAGEKVNLVFHILANQSFRRLYAIILIAAGLFILLLQL